MTINLIALRRALKNGNPTFSNRAMSELLDAHDAKAARVAELEAKLEQALEIIGAIADYSNYVTDGDIETENGVMHVSEYAAEWIKSVTPSAGEGR